MKKGRFLWSAHRITEKQKVRKARNIKEKQLKNSRSTAWRLPAALPSSASANLLLKNAKKARKYAYFRAFSIPEILSGLFGFDGIWTEIYGFIVVKLLVDKPILTSYGLNYWWTIGANEVQFCHRRTNTYLTDLHRALAYSLKTRMGRGSIFFARNPARQIWVPQDQIGNAGLACGTEDRAGNHERGREEKRAAAWVGRRK